MEEEAREILKVGLSTAPENERNLAQAILKRIEPLGGVELKLLPREPLRKPPKLD